MLSRTSSHFGTGVSKLHIYGARFPVRQLCPSAGHHECDPAKPSKRVCMGEDFQNPFPIGP
jgi:hypothetical protein